MFCLCDSMNQSYTGYLCGNKNLQLTVVTITMMETEEELSYLSSSFVFLLSFLNDGEEGDSGGLNTYKPTPFPTGRSGTQPLSLQSTFCLPASRPRTALQRRRRVVNN